MKRIVKNKCIQFRKLLLESTIALLMIVLIFESIPVTLANSLIEIPTSGVIDISIEALESDFNEVGDVIHYNIAVVNTGNTPLFDVDVITTPLLVDLSKPEGDIDGQLGSNKTLIYSGSYTITDADLSATQVNCTAQVYSNGTLINKASVTICAFATKMNLTMTATENGYSKVGDVLNYTLKLQNVGLMSLTGVSVIDPLVNLNGPYGDYDSDNQLDPSETWIYTGKYYITEADMINGKVDNTASAVTNEALAVNTSLTINDPPAVLTLNKTATLAPANTNGYESGRTFNLNLTARTNVTDVYVLTDLDIVLTLSVASGMNNNAPIMYYPIGAFYDANPNDLIISAKDYMTQSQTYYLSADGTNPITWSSTLNSWVNKSNVAVSATYTGTIYAYTNKALGYLIQAALKFVDDIIVNSPTSRIDVIAFNSIVTTTPGNVPLDLSVSNITLIKQFILSIATGNNSASLLAMQAIKTAFDNSRIGGILPDRQRVSIWMTGDKPNDSSNFNTVYGVAQNTLQASPYDVMMCSGNVLSTDATLITFLRNIATDPNRTDAVYPYYFLVSQVGQVSYMLTQIEKKVGSKLQDPVVKDYISPMFDVINPVTGLPLTDNLPVATNGIYHNSGGSQWIEWMPTDINSDTDWVSGTVILKAKTDFFGGNFLPTNQSGSGVYMQGSLYGSEFPMTYVNVALKFNLNNGIETIFKRQFLTLNLDSVANIYAMKPGTANQPYQSYEYGAFQYNWYAAEGVTLIPSPYTVQAPISNGTSYILKAKYIPLTPATDSNAIASVGTPSNTLQKQSTLEIQVLSGSLTITNNVYDGGISEPNQSFLFKIVRNYQGTIETYYETIQGSGSKTLTDLPIGNYTVYDLTNWSWRYTASPESEYNFNMNSSQLTMSLTFSSTRNIAEWLSSLDNQIN